MIPVKPVKTLSASLFKMGIKSPIMRAGIIAVPVTEVGFNDEKTAWKIRSESSYSNTPNDRLRMLFGNRLAGLTEPALTALKADNVKFFDTIYKGSGNVNPGDGWKFRGRGVNQITFFNAYKMIGQAIGVDLVTYPDRLNEEAVACDALAVFFVNGLKAVPSTILAWLDLKSVDDGTKLLLANLIAFQVNAGLGTKLTNPQYDDEHGRQVAVLSEILSIVNS